MGAWVNVVTHDRIHKQCSMPIEIHTKCQDIYVQDFGHIFGYTYCGSDLFWTILEQNMR